MFQGADRLLTPSHISPQPIRSMADNFFRPGFTQGVWANGELGKGLNYIAFVGNALNSINISAAKIDTNLLTFRQCLVGTAGAIC